MYLVDALSTCSSFSADTLSRQGLLPPNKIPLQEKNSLAIVIRKKLFFNIFTFCLLLFVTARWFFLIDQYSVNILFMDQWDFMGALMDRANLWDLFTWQHGPHRQGVGFFLTKIVADLSGWNTRVEAFAIGFVVFLAAFLAIILKLRLTSRFSALDVAIPLLYLNHLQIALFANTPNFSHGSMPLLLLTLFCVCWTIQHRIIRYAICAAINFMTIYTGFGFFLGCITPVLFVSEYLNAWSNKDGPGKMWSAVFCLVSVFSFMSFFIHYTFNSAVDDFVFPHPYPLEYLQFILINFVSFCGIRGSDGIAYILGPPLLCFLLFVLIKAGLGIFQNRGTMDVDKRIVINQIIVILISFSLLFSINLAVGRVCLGVGTARASRYLTYLIPAFTALYLYGVTREKIHSKLIAVCIAGFFLLTLSPGGGNTRFFNEIKQGKLQWKTYYLQTESISRANELSGFAIHPDPEKTELRRKLLYLKEHRRNLYLDAPVKKKPTQ